MGKVRVMATPAKECYIGFMNSVTKQILQKVAGWPEEDQQELAELARDIEARRTGVYELSDDERAAIADARRGAFASDDEAAAFWKRHGIS
jgi:hypothetical protein